MSTADPDNTPSDSGSPPSGEEEEETLYTCRLCKPGTMFTSAERDVHRAQHRSSRHRESSPTGTVFTPLSRPKSPAKRGRGKGKKGADKSASPKATKSGRKIKSKKTYVPVPYSRKNSG